MAYLTEDVLEAGRAHLRDGDLDAFMAWAADVPVRLDLGRMRQSMAQCLAAGDTERALKLFEMVWPVTDPEAERWKELRSLTILVVVGALVLFGLLGGVVYFFRAIS